MRSRRAEKAAKESETLRVALVRQEHVLAAQTQQVATCNALHELEDRDLLKSGSLPLTQEFLAQMLGVHRSSVTLVGPQTAGGRVDQLSARQHRGNRRRRAAGQLWRMLRCHQQAFQQAHRLHGRFAQPPIDSSV
jgi:hypothetical protein